MTGVGVSQRENASGSVPSQRGFVAPSRIPSPADGTAAATVRACDHTAGEATDVNATDVTATDSSRPDSNQPGSNRPGSNRPNSKRPNSKRPRHSTPPRAQRLSAAFALLLCATQAVAAEPVAARPGANAAEPRASGSCAIGSYRLADGRPLDIGPGVEGQLRWRSDDGRTGALALAAHGAWISTVGWTGRADGHRVRFDCAHGRLRFDDTPGQRVRTIQRDTRFRGSGVELAGRLTLPSGEGRVPLVVLVHGAEHDSALQRYSLQREFANAGIATFVYDKRGTGASGGRYTQDYLTLAVDAVHALDEARRLGGARIGRVGYQGGSQGGWVAPLAVRIAPVDFVVVGFGLAVSPLEEDREAIAFDLRRAGFGDDPAAMAGAMAIADATAALIDSGFAEGYERLAAVKAQYAQAPWYASVRGNFTWYLLGNDADTIRRDAPGLVRGVPAHYDPMPVLRGLDTPQLWALGGEDRDAPPGETLRRLAALQRAGKPIASAVFARADHGLYEFETAADGERVSTRQPDGYFRLMTDFILGKTLQPRYGEAAVCASAACAGG
ncbi:alpha/beta hydrolase [Lysobacter enzymogenes]|nr:alpha/beta hydrolase [Lysobacter enzymogenes]